MNTIDARKLNCPQPLILAKNALEGGMNEVLVLVDNDTAKQNILKYSNKMGYLTEITDINSDISIRIIKNESDTNLCSIANIEEKPVTINSKKGYLIGTNSLGNGSEELGQILMKGFIYTITQVKPYPDFMIFLNSGVKLTSENSDSIDDLDKLLQGGTRIVSCGTCLDFYQLKDKLKVGEVSNMYDIVEILTGSNNVMSIS